MNLIIRLFDLSFTFFFHSFGKRLLFDSHILSVCYLKHFIIYHCDVIKRFKLIIRNFARDEKKNETKITETFAENCNRSI